MFSQGTGPYISTGEGEKLVWGYAWAWDSQGSLPATCPNSSLSSARAASIAGPVRHPHLRPHLPSPPNPVSSGARGPTSRRSSSPHPAPQPSPPAGEHCLSPATKAPQAALGMGSSRGAGPPPRPRRPRGRRAPAHVQRQRCTAPSTPSGLRVWLPGPLPSAPTPTHHWPPQAPRAARVPPAPSLHQPSSKLSNLRSSPQLRSPGPRGARGARAGPGQTPTGSWQGQGPSPRGGRLLPKGPQRKGR